MSKIVKIVLVVIAALAVAGGVFWAGIAFGKSRLALPWGAWSAPVPRGYGRGYGLPRGGFGPMMPRYGFGPFAGPRARGGWAVAQPLTVEEARQAAQKFVDSSGLSGLRLGEIMIFDNNGYVVVEEADTGMGAFELLVDPLTKTAYPEPGPNMMWNLKYGGLSHGWMMGRGGMGWMMRGYGWNWANATPPDVSAEMPIMAEQAVSTAQEYLDRFLPGSTAAADPIKFYGYYTLDFLKDGKVVGMLSVNGYNGQVFVHTWHGTFIEEAE